MNIEKRIWELKPESELRCEVLDDGGHVLIVQLLEGNAEIFGIELAQKKEYIFKDTNIAIATWYGCKIETSGPSNILSGIYVSSETPMVSYVNTHIQLEARRDHAYNNNDNGPRVINLILLIKCFIYIKFVIILIIRLWLLVLKIVENHQLVEY